MNKAFGNDSVELAGYLDGVYQPEDPALREIRERSQRAGLPDIQVAGLDARGISYLHLRGLGTPKDGREAARGGKFALLHKIYAAHLKTTQAKEELDELSALVKKSGPVCILCYERDHTHCHRQWIAEIIEERDGVKVENLVAPQV